MESKAPPPPIARIVLTAFAAALIIKSVLFDIMISEGRSMLPTIRPGTVVLVNRAAYGLRIPFFNTYLISWKKPEPGDIVVFPAPDGLLAVKRIQETLSDGRVSALGDNRNESYDSRQYGPIVANSIIGKVMGIQ